MKLGSLNAVRVQPAGKPRQPPVLLLHGIGLGAWAWERDQAILAEAGLESWAVDLPGHAGAPAMGLAGIADAVAEAAAELGRPAIVGHDLGGMVAQMVGARCEVASIALIGPWAPENLSANPTWSAARALAPKLPSALLGRDVKPCLKGYVETTLHVFPEDQQRAIYDRITPWPSQLVLDLTLDRPEIPYGALDCPVLITFGFQDRSMRLNTARLLCDHYDGIIWRFDDLAHLPMLEPGGERHAQRLADWLKRPKRRQITEIDAFAPEEGVGDDVRDARRGGRRLRTRVHDWISL